MKFIITLFCILFSIPLAFGQQDPLYAQYMLNPLLINPAYSGFNNNLNVSVAYRNQWGGLEGHPQTFNASAHTSLLNNKVGVGIQFTHGSIGNSSTTQSDLLMAYKLELNHVTFSYGMQVGLQSYYLDFSDLRIFDLDDNAFTGGEQGTRLNIGAGAILHNERLFIGFSVPRMLTSSFENGGQEFDLYDQHYYLMGSYVLYISNQVRLKPSALLRGVKGAPMAVDLAFNVNINAAHTIGIFTRNFSTYGLLLQTVLNDKFRLGYVFELPTEKSVGPTYTTNEISLGLLLQVFSFHQNIPSNF